MSLVLNNNVVNGFVSEEFNSKQDPIVSLPKDLVLEIFSHLNLTTLGKISLISKKWKQLANEPLLWKIAIYREIAFGNDKWAHCFGKDIVKNEDRREELASLPLNDFIEDCKKFKSMFPEKNTKDRLMLVRLPKTLNGQLTLKSLGELAKKFFSDNDTGYRSIGSSIIDQQWEISIDKSRWVMMTKDILPDSRDKSYVKQQNLVSNLAQKGLINYEIPELLEAVACILSQYFDSKIRLFNDYPRTYIRCKDAVEDRQIVVGGFTDDGLNFADVCYDNELIGVAPLRKKFLI